MGVKCDGTNKIVPNYKLSGDVEVYLTRKMTIYELIKLFLEKFSDVSVSIYENDSWVFYGNYKMIKQKYKDKIIKKYVYNYDYDELAIYYYTK